MWSTHPLTLANSHICIHDIHDIYDNIELGQNILRIVTHCSVWEEEVAPVVVHRGEHGEEEGEQQHYDEDDHNHPRVQREVDLR